MKSTSGASATRRLTKRQQLGGANGYGTDPPSSRGASATKRLTKRRQQLKQGKEYGQLEEGNRYRQILSTAEVIMENENDKRGLGNQKAHKKAAAG